MGFCQNPAPGCCLSTPLCSRGCGGMLRGSPRVLCRGLLPWHTAVPALLRDDVVNSRQSRLVRGWLWDYAEPRSCPGAGRRRWVLHGPRAALPAALSFCLVCFVSRVVFSPKTQDKACWQLLAAPQACSVSAQISCPIPCGKSPGVWGLHGTSGDGAPLSPCPWGRMSRPGRAQLSCGTEINVKSWQSNEPKIQRRNKLLIASVVSGLLRGVCGFYVMCQSLPGAQRRGTPTPMRRRLVSLLLLLVLCSQGRKGGTGVPSVMLCAAFI